MPNNREDGRAIRIKQGGADKSSWPQGPVARETGRRQSPDSCQAADSSKGVGAL